MPFATLSYKEFDRLVKDHLISYIYEKVNLNANITVLEWSPLVQRKLLIVCQC